MVTSTARDVLWTLPAAALAAALALAGCGGGGSSLPGGDLPGGGVTGASLTLGTPRSTPTDGGAGDGAELRLGSGGGAQAPAESAREVPASSRESDEGGGGATAASHLQVDASRIARRMREDAALDFTYPWDPSSREYPYHQSNWRVPPDTDDVLLTPALAGTVVNRNDRPDDTSTLEKILSDAGLSIQTVDISRNLEQGRRGDLPWAFDEHAPRDTAYVFSGGERIPQDRNGNDLSPSQEFGPQHARSTTDFYYIYEAGATDDPDFPNRRKVFRWRYKTTERYHISDVWVGVRVHNQLKSDVGASSLSETDTYVFGKKIEGTFRAAGVPMGDLICLGTDCRVTATMLTGGWYVLLEGDAVYSNLVYRFDGSDGWEVGTFVPYAEYGYWVDADHAVRTYSRHVTDPFVGPSGANRFRTTGTDSTTVIWQGEAVGVSAITTSSGGVSTTNVGGFTASAGLVAVFGDSPTISGTINQFASDDPGKIDHVDSSWSVSLPTTAFDTDNGTFSAESGGTSWTGTIYGDNAANRPLGAHGGFRYVPDANTAVIGAFSAR